MDIFCIWHFHNASKEVFWPKKVLNFMHGFKSAILQNEKIAKTEGLKTTVCFFHCVSSHSLQVSADPVALFS
jgi:hypothetical protein